MDIGKSMAVAMAMKGMTNIQLAEELKCSRQYISQIKSSKVSTGSTILKLANHFDMKASEFIKLGE